jgi:hypothetical protein
MAFSIRVTLNSKTQHFYKYLNMKKSVVIAALGAPAQETRLECLSSANPERTGGNARGRYRRAARAAFAHATGSRGSYPNSGRSDGQATSTS